MGTIVIKKKTGRPFSGAEIAKAHWIREDGGKVYTYDPCWAGRFATDPIAKMFYLEAVFNTLGRIAVGRRRKAKGARLFRRLENLERRVVNYIPNCTGVDHGREWRFEDVPASQRPYYPEFRYGKVDADEAGAVAALLREEGICDFDFVIDSRYVLVFEAGDGAWDAMKAAGIIDLGRIEAEWPV